MNRQLPKFVLWFSLFLVILAGAGFLYLDAWLARSIHSITIINHDISLLSLTYFHYVGTDAAFSYLYIILIAVILYQWHVHRHIAYKPLFIVLSLSVTLSIIYCLSTFFYQYIPHLVAFVNKSNTTLLNDPSKAFPSGHIARFITLLTSFYILFPKKGILLFIMSLAIVLLIGVGLLFENHYVISGLCIGTVIGIIVPHYVKNLIFVQRIFHSRSGLERVNLHTLR
jgi:hypothetical protein